MSNVNQVKMDMEVEERTFWEKHGTAIKDFACFAVPYLLGATVACYEFNKYITKPRVLDAWMDGNTNVYNVMKRKLSEEEFNNVVSKIGMVTWKKTKSGVYEKVTE